MRIAGAFMAVFAAFLQKYISKNRKKDTSGLSNTAFEVVYGACGTVPPLMGANKGLTALQNSLIIKNGDYFMEGISENPLFEQAVTYYEANKPAIREKYLGKQLVISGDKILGAYDDVGTAYHETVKTTPLGSFIIQDVPVDIEDEIIYLSPVLGLAHV